jgi:xylulokinase
MTQPVVIGVDLGTTSCKAGAFSLSGELLGHGTSSCTVNRPLPNWVEQDCSQFWDSAVGAIRQALASIEPSAVIGLACCGHTPSLVLLDGAGRPVRPAIIWQDSRASLEAGGLEQEIAPEQWKAWLGLDLPRNASYPPARLRWLRTHEPAALLKTRQLLQPKDYLNYLLTGQMASDYWGSKGLVHLNTGEPVEAYRSVLGIDPALAPPCRHPHHFLGSLSSESASALGLAKGVPVATGWTDALCGMLGTGALAQSGSAFDIAGTSEIVGLTSWNEPTNHAGVLVAPILDTDLRVVYGPTQTSGGAVDWFVSTFLSKQGSGDTVALDDLPAPSSAGLLFLPYLEGERAPIWDPKARGMFFGVSLEHTKADFLRAVLEGVAFSVRHVLETAEQATGKTADTLHLSGGGATSEIWNRIKSDVLGRRVQPTFVRDAGTLGAAMLAALAVNAFSHLKEATEAMVRQRPPVLPNKEMATRYDRLYLTYRELYRRVHDLY